jgi:hypothetical protein
MYWAHNQEVVGSNPVVYKMDVSNKASYNIEKKEITVAKWGSPKKILKQKFWQ